MIDTWNLVSVVITVLSVVLIFIITNRRQLIIHNESEDDRGGITFLIERIARVEKENERLQSLLSTLTALWETSDKESEEIKRALRKDILDLRTKVIYLEGLLYERTGPIDSEDGSQTSLANILVVGADADFQKTDENALQKARLQYRRISSATQDKISAELRRRRHESNMYKYVVFSAHMDSTGILMSDGTILNGFWLAQNLSGVELVYLNGCESTEIADVLIGIVDYVISVTEVIEDDVAGSFASAFWYKIKSGDTIQQSYDYALIIEPSASSYVDIQSRSKPPVRKQNLPGQ